MKTKASVPDTVDPALDDSSMRLKTSLINHGRKDRVFNISLADLTIGGSMAARSGSRGHGHFNKISGPVDDLLLQP
jgi:hypothetical protein